MRKIFQGERNIDLIVQHYQSRNLKPDRLLVFLLFMAPVDSKNRHFLSREIFFYEFAIL